MNLNLLETLDDIKSALVKGAITAFVSAVIARIFAPKPSSIQVEEGIPTEIYTLGKRGNPKIVYVSTKKHHINLFPAIFMLAAAAGVSAAKKQLEETSVISSDR